MIDWLRVSKSAYFYRKHGNISKAAISELFRDIRQSADTPSNNVFHHVKERLRGITWSALSFFYERDPAFLDPSPATRERICAFIFLVEHRGHLAVFKSNLELPTSFKPMHLRRVPDDRVEAAIGRAGAIFEQMRLRNMTASKSMMRFKTLEADDLENVVAPFGTSRYVPRGYRVRQSGDYFTTTPNTGRIAMRSERSRYKELIDWGTEVVDLLVDQTSQPSDFIRTFARPADLGSLDSAVKPTYFSIDTAALSADLFAVDEPMELVRKTATGDIPLTRIETEALLSSLNPAFQITAHQGTLNVVDPATNNSIGELAIGKTRISLKKFDVASIGDIRIRPALAVAGGEHDSVPLKRYVDQQDRFTVLFSDLAIVYLDGSLYRDDSMADGSRFLAYCRGTAHLNDAENEKGQFTVGQTEFDLRSVFRTVINDTAQLDTELACDDLGDEWADFIGVNVATQPRSISFYHAKHDALSLGASPLQILVAQATKNLGRFTSNADVLNRKVNTWAGNYNADGVATAIPRMVRGTTTSMLAALVDATRAPDTIRKVFIVTSSLSFGSMRQAFAAIRAGLAPTPHFVQLYWLLSSFFSACNEVGAFPYVICRE